jgi:mono/diheme cytochrome c family protein
LKIEVLSVLSALILISACTEQFDPSYTRNMLEEERITGNAQHPSLTDDGKLPGEAEEKPFVAAEVYAQLCSSCHGMTGKADTAGAMALNPKPRNFTDKAWQASVDDTRIYNVLKNGGSSVGLSATMVSFAGVLDSDEKLNAMVKYVRHFGK